MTLVLAMANGQHVIQASDRRLVRGQKVDTEAANKIGYAICDDAHFLYGFSGLARTDSGHVTTHWLADLLWDATVAGRRFPQLLPQVTELLTKRFRSDGKIQRLNAADKRLTIMFTGYWNEEYVFNTLISNFQDFESGVDLSVASREFRHFSFRSAEVVQRNPTLIRVIGARGAFLPEDENRVREMLEQQLPRNAMMQKAIDLVQEIARRPTSGGVVGESVGAACINLGKRSLPWVSFGPGAPTNTMPLIDSIDLRTGSIGLRIADVEMRVEGETAIVPRVHRNRPCPCGSGKKYRHCHMKS